MSAVGDDRPELGGRLALHNLDLRTTVVALVAAATASIAGVGISPSVGATAATARGHAGAVVATGGPTPAASPLTPSARLALTHASHQTGIPAPHSYHPHVRADGAIPRPPWWHGTCDGKSDGTYPGSHRLGAGWDGLVACGPGPNEGGSDHLVDFFQDAWGEFEWECVELSMRWMYLAWGVPPYAANGNEVVDNYAGYNPNGPHLKVVKNGTPGFAPLPGDVLELTDSDSFGHTEVVTGSYVDSKGDGTVRVMTENLDNPTDGWYELPVTHWVVSGGFGTVVDWLHNPKWTLEEPLVSELSAAGTVSLRVDATRGPLRQIATGVRQAEIVGGGGAEPAPMIVLLTDSGEVQVGYDLPGAPMWTLASGATQVTATSGEGRTGLPTIGWLTKAGDFYTVSSGFGATPVLEATKVESITIASDSSAAEPLLGYVTAGHKAFEKLGTATGAFQHVASGVATLDLAGDGTATESHAVEAYLGVGGRGFERVGMTGRFSEITPPTTSGHGSSHATPTVPTIRDVRIAAVGPHATPLTAFVTSTGDAYARLGDSGAWIHESDGARSVQVAAGLNDHAFPILAVKGAKGTWSLKEGTLSSRYVAQPSSRTLGLAALVVS